MDASYKITHFLLFFCVLPKHKIFQTCNVYTWVHTNCVCLCMRACMHFELAALIFMGIYLFIHLTSLFLFFFYLRKEKCFFFFKSQKFACPSFSFVFLAFFPAFFSPPFFPPPFSRLFSRLFPPFFVLLFKFFYPRCCNKRKQSLSI